MNKSIDGIPLFLFRLWLYAPLLFLVYVDYLTLASFGKVGWPGTLITLGASFLIAWSVIFSEDFRDFSRSTPFRILFFYCISFIVAEMFVVVWASLNGDFRVSHFLVTVPATTALFVTPAMVMRLEVLLPDKADKPYHSDLE